MTNKKSAFFEDEVRIEFPAQTFTVGVLFLQSVPIGLAYVSDQEVCVRTPVGDILHASCLNPSSACCSSRFTVLPER